METLIKLGMIVCRHCRKLKENKIGGLFWCTHLKKIHVYFHNMHFHELFEDFQNNHTGKTDISEAFCGKREYQIQGHKENKVNIY